MAATLSEGFLLLALDDRRGSFGRLVDYGLAGTALRELAEVGRIAIDDYGFSVTDTQPTEDEALDSVLATVAVTDQGHALQYWVRELGQRAPIRPMLLERLVSTGILCREGVSRRARYPAQNTGPEAETIQRLRAVLLDGAVPDASSTTLIGMLRTCLLMGAVLAWGERRRARGRIQELALADPIAGAAERAVTADEMVRARFADPQALRGRYSRSR